ncbi:hypothetical protein GCM10023193_70460 [Planotetraspora kaengkrachanensis]|uniref:Uncharacterized protein n=1 Tax=Planotetraspora kaengkrachanensis TaxID=575193 RepID=A0A8J3PZ96_9ACTN|nr:hypothetical protein Pka01_67250 [Planotetraspora kaengkrachanensis]
MVIEEGGRRVPHEFGRFDGELRVGYGDARDGLRHDNDLLRPPAVPGWNMPWSSTDLTPQKDKNAW